MTSTAQARASSGTISSGRGTRRRRLDGQGIWPWLFIAPITLGTAVFYIWPIFRNFYLSFTTSGPFGGTTWTGLANYSQLFSNSDLVSALIHTVVYTAIVMLGVPLALTLAALINRPGLRFARGYQTLFFLPYVAMPVAIAQVWKVIYNGDYGILNAFLGVFGIPHVYWVSTPGWALIATSVVGLWISLGFNMIVLLAGLKGIPPELYEAASIDGASHFRQFFAITVPMVSRTTFFLSVVTAIGGFQLFDLLFVLIGPNNPVMPQTQSLVFLFWHASFHV